MKLPFFKKADLILVVLAVLLGAGSLLAFGRGEEGRTAVISVDGEVVQTVPLSDEGWTGTIDTSYGSNSFKIENGAISVTEADCRGKDCTHFSPISRSGQTIVCIPHHLVVTISGSEEGSPDTVVR